MKLSGTVYIACNCDYGCPCNFNALPTRGFCEGGWTWCIDAGEVGDVALDGVAFTLQVKWPGAIHDGGGEGILVVDERASDDQVDAVSSLVRGEHGGPWAILAWTWPTLHGPHQAPFEVEADGVTWKLDVGDVLEVRSGPIRNPVSGAEVHPGAVLPEGLVVKQADFGSASTFRVGEPLGLEYADTYTAVGRFEYAGD